LKVVMANLLWESSRRDIVEPELWRIEAGQTLLQA